MNFKRWILGLRPVQFFVERVLPKLRFTTAYPQMTGSAWNAFLLNAKPGDLVFSTDGSKLSSWLIPGVWDHVGIVCLDGGELVVVEAVQPKVRRSTLFDFCHHADFVGIARPERLNPEQLEKFQVRALALVGIRYDALFQPGREALYCSEVVLESWPYGDDFNNFSPLLADMTDEAGIGTSYATPDDIWAAYSLTKIFASKAGII